MAEHCLHRCLVTSPRASIGLVGAIRGGVLGTAWVALRTAPLRQRISRKRRGQLTEESHPPRHHPPKAACRSRRIAGEAGRRGWGREARCCFHIAALQAELIRERLDRGTVIQPGRFGFDLKRNVVRVVDTGAAA